nr:STAS/SEC14 domain-containing protein [Arthrobacter alpinus]
MGIERLKAWERFAIVSYAAWVHHVAKVFGLLMPGGVRAVTISDLEVATAWVAG